jgi:BMFP domain-containing protein YqiC
MTSASEFLEQLQTKIGDLLAQTPVADVQKNLKALLAQQFAALDLVTRAEFDEVNAVLIATRKKLDELEARLPPSR